MVQVLDYLFVQCHIVAVNNRWESRVTQGNSLTFAESIGRTMRDGGIDLNGTGLVVKAGSNHLIHKIDLNNAAGEILKNV